MRKLIVSMNCTLDGYLSGPNCEMDWHFRFWDEEMCNVLIKELSLADTVLMGRTTFNVFSKFINPVLQYHITGRENFPFFDMLNRYHKIVFSKTLKEVDWQHSSICRANIKKKIIDLKKQTGKNIMLYGSAKLLHCIQALDLIDSYQLYYHPVILGNGKRMFTDRCIPEEFQLQSLDKFSSGVVFIEISRYSNV